MHDLRGVSHSTRVHSNEYPSARRRPRRSPIPCVGGKIVVALTLLAALGWASTASAGIYTVTKLTDSNDGVCDADCSLREAIIAANNEPGSNTVTLGPGTHVLSITGIDEDAALTGDLDISDDLILEGQGADLTAVDAGGIDRVFDILQGSTVTFSRVSVRGGSVAASGAGIRNRGQLSIVDCEVRDNETMGFAFGAGIGSDFAGSSLHVERSTVANNTAVGGGGGIAVGIEVSIINSTISGNSSTSDFGGGLYVFSDTIATLNNVTVFDNDASAVAGGVIFELDVVSSVSNSVFASNRIGLTPNDCNGLFGSTGYNLVSAATCSGFTATGDMTGSSAMPLDARLEALSLNGASTASHQPATDSPLLDAGSPAAPGTGGGACEAIDQRSFARPIDGNGNSTAICDIGSIELGAGPEIFTDGFEAGNTSAWSSVVSP